MTKKQVLGVLLLNKSTGMSSHAALSQAKRLFMSPQYDSKKAGHTGTLDPMATGLLPVVFGEATKFSSFGLDADKGYTATIRLGEQTDTGDKEGQVIKRASIPAFDQHKLDDIAQAFIGAQAQVPPMYSALKKDGKKLYEYAREGIDIERSARPITIHRLSLAKISDDTVKLDVICSKGTYVRVLGEDVALALGTVGYLVALHRTATGGFEVESAVGLDELVEMPFERRLDRLLPIDALLAHLPIIRLTTDETKRIKLGQRLNIKDRLDTLSFEGDTVQIRLYHDDFIGLGEVTMTGRLQPKKLVT